MKVLHLILLGFLSGCAVTTGCTADISGFCHENSHRFKHLTNRNILIEFSEDVKSSEAAKGISVEYSSKYSNVYATTDWIRKENTLYCRVTITPPNGIQDSKWFKTLYHELRHCDEGNFHTVDYKPIR